MPNSITNSKISGLPNCNTRVIPNPENYIRFGPPSDNNNSNPFLTPGFAKHVNQVLEKRVAKIEPLLDANGEKYHYLVTHGNGVTFRLSIFQEAVDLYASGQIDAVSAVTNEDVAPIVGEFLGSGINNIAQNLSGSA